ncbi:hypothetical protein A1OE_1470 [Candidatus Endolissoclinum faulkneri L2]|uniref:Uncharacterized protein n=1 Tax=Candidatus Endolissoclinum faulkneri L2 TaxID=1193729 RepID=K7YST9_9PROT|nr:hypothetical protein A1OE_1470 [Candidatus Endolissoclinum faulkneri L2]
MVILFIEVMIHKLIIPYKQEIFFMGVIRLLKRLTADPEIM